MAKGDRFVKTIWDNKGHVTSCQGTFYENFNFTYFLAKLCILCKMILTMICKQFQPSSFHRWIAEIPVINFSNTSYLFLQYLFHCELQKYQLYISAILVIDYRNITVNCRNTSYQFQQYQLSISTLPVIDFRKIREGTF